MKLASYKGTQGGWRGVANVLIRLRLRGRYSHTELVFEAGDAVDHLMPDGTCNPDEHGALWCASSAGSDRMPEYSLRRAGRHGGIRFKRINLDPAKWDLLDVDGLLAIDAASWFYWNQGKRYDWSLILGFLAWFFPQRADRYICSESCAAALGFNDAWRFDPCVLHEVVSGGIRRLQFFTDLDA